MLKDHTVSSPANVHLYLMEDIQQLPVAAIQQNSSSKASL